MKISLQNLHQSCKGTNGEFKEIKWPWDVKVKVKHIKNHENHLLSHNFGTGSRRNFWLVGKHSLQNSASVSDPQILTYDVTFLRHLTSNKMNNFEKKIISSNRQGQRSNLRSRSNKGQRSRSFDFFLLFCMLSMWYSWIYEKWKSASTIVNFQPILLKIDTHNVWTYPM